MSSVQWRKDSFNNVTHFWTFKTIAPASCNSAPATFYNSIKKVPNQEIKMIKAVYGDPF